MPGHVEVVVGGDGGDAEHSVYAAAPGDVDLEAVEAPARSMVEVGPGS